MKMTTLATSLLLAGVLAAPIALANPDTDRSHPKAFVKDSVITTKIKAKLAEEHLGSMGHIKVDTDKNGIVWMTGTANSQTEVNQAVAIAKNTEGVKSVHSELTVQKDK